MKIHWTPETLIAFEEDIKETFNRGEIKAPIHLAGGNEKVLIDIFERVQPQDWCCGTWRSHYHCLLKGVPPEELKRSIIEGRSIALCFPEHRIICSALVGGIAPIAVGLAMGAKRANSNEKVWCFIGDMAASTGIVRECADYACGHKLPLTFVIEDNGLSVSTDTEKSWGKKPVSLPNSWTYKYKMTCDHVGSGSWVSM